jgi:hypothetical protein
LKRDIQLIVTWLWSTDHIIHTHNPAPWSTNHTPNIHIKVFDRSTSEPNLTLDRSPHTRSIHRRPYAREIRAAIIIHNPRRARRRTHTRKHQHREHARAENRSQENTYFG